MDISTVGSLAAFVLILVFLVVLRAKNSKFEVRVTDIVVAVLPVVLFLLITGRIQSLQIGELKVETAFKQASQTPITSQIAPLKGLPTEPIQLDPKRGVEEVPRLVEKKTEGLLFRLGHGGYYGPAVREYFQILGQHPFLRFVIIENPDRTFFGMAGAPDLAALFSGSSGDQLADQFARSLNAGDRSSLQKLPGFIPAEKALSETAVKTQALRQMEEQNLEHLPVINRERRFLGIVNRSRLTASLIIDVAQGLK
ncbi:MAG: hypothetical protein JXB25_09785 [Deltaproteobacteria bacterium]|nr:hypothetical protein [Deltaproteobacteria bacterium]